MSITLPPLPDPDYANHYGGAQMDAHAFTAVEADRASRVPMAEDQMDAIFEVSSNGLSSFRRNFFKTLRAAEAHHGIGAKPAQPLMCVKCGVDRAKSPCRMPFIATTLCPFTEGAA